MKLAISAFEGLCAAATPQDLQRLKRRVNTHVSTIAEAALSKPDLPVELAKAIAERLETLADTADKLDAAARQLVRGAMMYFVLTTDDEDDLGGPNGLDDDAAILNRVCEDINRQDLKITT
jgi:hypothetical protein